jgi:hypothetical protein
MALDVFDHLELIVLIFTHGVFPYNANQYSLDLS